MKQIIGYASAFFILCIGLVLAFGSWGTVSAGHRGITLRNGAVVGEVKPEGLYFKTPWIESVIEMDVRIKKNEEPTEAASKDLQIVTATIALNYHIQPEMCAKIYQSYGTTIEATLIDPALKESTKSVIAQYTAEELISKREAVRSAIRELLATKLSPTGIAVDATNIVNFSFSRTFDAAIEAKVTAEQNALAAKNKLEQIKFEADQKVAEARGKAEAITIESNALQSNPQILQLRALEKWDGHMPQVMGAGALPFINVGSLAKP